MQKCGIMAFVRDTRTAELINAKSVYEGTRGMVNRSKGKWGTSGGNLD